MKAGEQAEKRYMQCVYRMPRRGKSITYREVRINQDMEQKLLAM